MHHQWGSHGTTDTGWWLMGAEQETRQREGATGDTCQVRQRQASGGVLKEAGQMETGGISGRGPWGFRGLLGRASPGHPQADRTGRGHRKEEERVADCGSPWVLLGDEEGLGRLVLWPFPVVSPGFTQPMARQTSLLPAAFMDKSLLTQSLHRHSLGPLSGNWDTWEQAALEDPEYSSSSISQWTMSKFSTCGPDSVTWT